MKNLSDSDLTIKIKNGCESAFREIYERYHKQMYFIAKGYLKRDSLSQDAIQDVFIILWEHRHKLDEQKSIKGFLFTSLKNHLLNVLRKIKPEIISTESLKTEVYKDMNVVSDDLIYQEYHEIVKKGMNELSDRKREVFEMKAYFGYSNSEIAEILKINIRTVKTHYYNSSQHIRMYLRNQSNISMFLVFVLFSFLIR